MKFRLFLSLLVLLVVFVLTLRASDGGGNFSIDGDGLPEVSEQLVVELKDGQTYDMTIEMVAQRIGGQMVKRLAYNGSIPGPLIKVKQGSRVTINLTNNSDVAALLHSHGLRLDNPFDGTHAVQDPIPIGGSFRYELKFPDAGLYWYHPHHREDYAQDMGLYGNYLVEPTDPDYWSPVNREVNLMLDDVLFDDDGNIVPYRKAGTDRTIMGRFGNVMLINGRSDYQLDVKQGEVIRFLVTNVANVRPFNLAIPGAEVKLVGSDIGKYEKEEFIDELIISPSERYILEAYFPNSGRYEIVNKIPGSEVTLGSINVKEIRADKSYASHFKKLRTNRDISDEIDAYRSYFDAEPDKTLDFSVELNMDMSGLPCHEMPDGSLMGDCDETDKMIIAMENMPCHEMPDGTKMGKCGDEEAHDDEKIEWEDNMQAINASSNNENVKWKMTERETGAINTNIDWNFKVGDLVKIRLFNDPESEHPMQHPFHIHGQRFLVLSTNGVQNNNFVWKDTTLLQRGDVVDILLEVSNPGTWLLHCHISEHIENGMKLRMKVEKA